MNLTYRGVGYDCEPPTIDQMDSQVGGQYRGQPWAWRYPRHVLMSQPNIDLKYRGVHYRFSEPTPATAPEKVRSVSTPTVRSTLMSEVAKVHRANLCRNLERRLQTARAKGDKSLIQLLENESQQLICAWQ